MRIHPLTWLAGRSPAALTFAALVASSWIYRAALIGRLLTEDVTPFSFLPTPQALISLAQHLAVDGAVAAALAGVVAGVGRLGPRLAAAAAAGLLLVWGLAAGAHFDVVFALHEGFGWQGLVEWFGGNFGWRDLQGYATPWAFALGACPLACAALMRIAPARWGGAGARAVAVATALMVVAALPARFPGVLDLTGWQPKTALRRLPLLYLGADAVERALRSRSPLARRADTLPPLLGAGPALTDPAFRRSSDAPSPPPSPGAAGGASWNVVVLLMESVSARRALAPDTSATWPTPMPFLARIASEGLHLSDHRSTSNSSARSIFSILSGLYPLPRREMFSTRPDLAIPSLAGWLRPADAFLVTPSRLQSYFPRSWLQNTGLREQHGFDELPPSATGRPQWPSGRNELDAVDFFLDRLGAAQEPFLAVYYSYAPHYDYYDYGPAWRIAPDVTKPLHRYVNNLALLDAQIRRVFDRLRADGRLDRTVVLLVGDHGEAFGEHEGNRTHSRHSYEENLRTPAILWQPRLFPPGRVSSPSSHVDLAPTLMAALGRPIPQAQVQGEILSPARTPERTFTFSYGAEDTLTALRWDGRKVQWRKAAGVCVVLDLQADPAERAATPCPANDPQVDAMLRFERFQRALLPALAAKAP